jgi:hypothetical protein
VKNVVNNYSVKVIFFYNVIKQKVLVLGMNVKVGKLMSVLND